MTLTTDVIIANVEAGLSILLRGVNNWRFKKSQPVISTPLINQNAANNLFFRFSGQTEEISFGFVLKNDGVNVSDGTNIIAIVSISQQIAYLRNSIFTENFDNTWTLQQVNGPGYFPSRITGVMTLLELDADAGSPAFGQGSITFIRGRVAPL